ADAEQGFLVGEPADRIDGVTHRLRIARAVGQEDAVRLVSEDVVGAGGAGHDRNAAARLHQAARDVPLHAEIQGDDVRRAAGDTVRVQLLRRKTADETFF